MSINLTPVLQAVVSLCAALITWRVVPLLQEKWGRERVERLLKTTGIAVRAAEEMFRESKSGAAKLDYVLKYLKERGFDVSADELRATVEAAVYQMNNALSESVDAIGFDVEDNP